MANPNSRWLKSNSRYKSNYRPFREKDGWFRGAKIIKPRTPQQVRDSLGDGDAHLHGV